MPLRYHPTIIHQAPNDGPGDGYDVVFPDLLGCVSTGDSVQDAAVHAAEALSLMIEGMRENGEPVPNPSPPGIVPDWLAEAKIVAHVMVPVERPVQGRA